MSIMGLWFPFTSEKTEVLVTDLLYVYKNETTGLVFLFFFWFFGFFLLKSAFNLGKKINQEEP